MTQGDNIQCQTCCSEWVSQVNSPAVGLPVSGCPSQSAVYEPLEPENTHTHTRKGFRNTTSGIHPVQFDLHSRAYLSSSLHLLTGTQLLLHGWSDLTSLELQLTSTHVRLQRELQRWRDRIRMIDTKQQLNIVDIGTRVCVCRRDVVHFLLAADCRSSWLDPAAERNTSPSLSPLSPVQLRGETCGGGGGVETTSHLLGCSYPWWLYVYVIYVYMYSICIW